MQAADDFVGEVYQPKTDPVDILDPSKMVAAVRRKGPAGRGTEARLAAYDVSALVSVGPTDRAPVRSIVRLPRDFAKVGEAPLRTGHCGLSRAWRRNSAAISARVIPSRASSARMRFSGMRPAAKRRRLLVVVFMALDPCLVLANSSGPPRGP